MVELMSAFVSFFVFLLTSVPRTSAQKAFVVPWSTKTYGPDGPWQAVKITAGGNDNTTVISAQNHTDLDLYPGAAWETFTLKHSACSRFTKCGVGGTWDPDQNQLDEQQTIQWRQDYSDASFGFQAPQTSVIYLGMTIGSQTVWNVTYSTATFANVTYPNATVGGLPLGFLSLGGDDPGQVWSLSAKQGDNIETNLFAGKLYKDKTISSYSFGLHIGSAAFQYPGSLMFGGYNKGRVIAPITSFSNTSQLSLLDIGIGVEFGDSPFNFTSQQNLLVGGMTSVRPEPIAPYLALPGKTCQAIANLLPVTFDQGLKFYLWNTNDPLFAKIVQSPSFLSFTFPPAAGDTANVVIKVPFALLNLTLDTPIVSKPTQYFPCVPYDKAGDVPVLGRAFLQAAFIGRNWVTKTSWLAQAPGPGVSGAGLGDTPTDIADGDTSISGFTAQNLFNQSWAGHWSVITSVTTRPNGTAQTTSTPEPPNGGLSAGAKAGIGVGVSLGAIAIIGAAFFFWRQRASKQDKATELYANSPMLQINGEAKDGVHELDQAQGLESDNAYKYTHTTSPTQELAAHLEPVEMPDSNIDSHR